MLLANARQTSERDCGRAPHGACRAQTFGVHDARDTSLFTRRGGINRISSCCDFRSCRGARVPALSRRPNGPLIRASGSIPSSRQSDLVWLAIRDISSLRGTGELCGRCFGIGRFFFTRALFAAAASFSRLLVNPSKISPSRRQLVFMLGLRPTDQTVAAGAEHGVPKNR